MGERIPCLKGRVVIYFIQKHFKYCFSIATLTLKAKSKNKTPKIFRELKRQFFCQFSAIFKQEFLRYILNSYCL